MFNTIENAANRLRRRGISPILIGIALTGLIWLLGGYLIYSLVTRSSPPKQNPVTETPVIEEAIVYRRALDGVVVALEASQQVGIYGVMIDNILEARPPAGISKAKLVFELPVEMGITRFLAVFANGDEVKKIGPVRSARPYAVDLMSEFNGMYLHIGGSPAALDEIANSNLIYNVGETLSPKTIYRVKTRAAPHNAYTDSENMAALFALQSRTFGPVAPWLYRDEKKPDERSGNAGVVINFSTYQYEAEWKYDSAANDYIRYEGRVRHKDEDGSEIRAKNVAVMITSSKVLDDKGRLDMPVIGTGKAMILSEGVVINGTWKKDSAADRLRFFGQEGGEVSFIPGTTWVEVVDGVSKVKIKE
ncbi:MAG: DUF3048 domain-containing protein [bacterium]